MRRSWKTIAIAVVGAAALASGAYAIGTQTGGGSADANGTKPSYGPPGTGAGFRAPFDNLAKALGVSQDDLRNALEDFRKQHVDQRKDDFAAALAKALGKSTADVEKALQDQKDKARDDFAKRLADSLGKSQSEVRSALDKVKMDDKSGPRSFFDDLAKELGVSTDRLERALRDARPHRFGPDWPFSGLAKALGVTETQLRDALQTLWRDHRPDVGGREKELAQFLADRFHLSVDKVEKALQDSRPPFPGKGHWRGPRGNWHGPGPGDPGPGGPPPGGPWGGP
jgi:Clp amino terminal domain, pathogenicity island component